jgi:2-methylisocitrate lyase-like PEP mutase family enzyme
MNDHISSARRGDDQLLAIMDQAAAWTVNGRAGCVLGTAYRLRDAIRRVFDYEASGQHVFAVCRQPGNEIILFREQVERVAAAVGMTHRRGWPAALSI